MASHRGRVTYAEMMARFARYCERREAGDPIWKAAESIGVTPNTGTRYERSYQALRRGETLAGAGAAGAETGGGHG